MAEKGGLERAMVSLIVFPILHSPEICLDYAKGHGRNKEASGGNAVEDVDH